MSVDTAPAYERVEVHNAGTRYIAHVARTETTRYLMLVSGLFGNCGQWIALPVGEDEVHWSYLTEKAPDLARWGGDREGWGMLFAEIGIRVFGGEE